MKGCGAPNPCPFASREGLGGGPQPLSISFGGRPQVMKGWGPATLVHLQVVKGWGGGLNPCPFASREGLGGGGILVHLRLA